MRRLFFICITTLIIITSASYTLSRPVYSQNINSDDPTVFFEEFLKTWLVTQNIDDAAAYFLLDETGVKKQFRIPQEEHFDSKTWLRKTLVMWLYKDHGLLNAWGHGNPRAAGYEKIPSDVTNITPLEKIQPETIRLAVKQFSGVTAYGDKTAIDFFIILRHIRRDTLFFRVKNISGEWKIVLHEWMIQ